MTVKFVTELTKEELIKVFNRNSILQADVLDEMLDSELFWISEKMTYIQKYLSDWSVDANSPCFINVKTDYIAMRDFLYGLIEMQKNIPAFSEDKAELIIERLEDALDAYAYAPMNADNYEELEQDAMQATAEAAKELAKQFEEDLKWCFDKKHQLEYFLDFYVDARLNEKAYVIPEEGTYQLYEDVHYTKSY